MFEGTNTVHALNCAASMIAGLPTAKQNKNSMAFSPQANYTD
jgi:hypothetical protein